MPILNHDVNGITIGQRQIDGYVNATAMCSASGKKLTHYLENQTTQAFLQALSLNVGIPTFKLVEVKKGRYGGTWVHPQVAINLGQWCSPEFAVLVSQWVVQWMTCGSASNQTTSPEIKSPRWYRRLVDYHRHNNVARDRFCIFFETTTTVVADLEALGYLVPDCLMLDISTGLGFRHHLVRRGFDLESPGFRTKYQLRIPLLEHLGQWQTIEPWQYKLELLGEFRSYINEYWWQHQSLQYFRKADPIALPAIHQRLGLPYQHQLSLMPES